VDGRQPSFQAALRFWFKLGWISFGGTAAHIAIMLFREAILSVIAVSGLP
jgi:chromate transport protein ChrA